MNARKDLKVKLDQLERQLGGPGSRGYWQCLEELADTESFQQLMKQEFPALADVWPDALSRRKFLSLMGASLALAGLGGCSVKPAPRTTILPYVHPPEEVVPGIPLFFATTMVHAEDAVGLLAESHEGRPIKIEGNPDHPASLGATSIFHQASVLTLYDPARSQTVVEGNQVRGWNDVDAAFAAILTRQRERGGAGLRLLTETVVSPTLAEQIETLLDEFPDAKWHQYEPINNVAGMRATQAAFGEYVNPVYDFRAADVVLSLDADFLTTGPGHLRYAKEFMDRRRVRTGAEDAHTAEMNRLYVVETAVSCTGAKADHRLAVRMRDFEPVARAIAADLGIEGVQRIDTPHSAWTRIIADDLRANAGRCLIMAGHRQPAAVHVLAHAMNEQLENQGRTVRYTRSAAARPVDQFASLAELVEDIEQDRVEALIILGGNPVYTAPADLEFGDRLAKVPHSFHLGLYEDETSRRCTWHLPQAHYLESWGDARAYDGTLSLVQPLIAPLYQGRSIYQVLASMLGQRDLSAEEIVRARWRSQWEKAGDDASDTSFQEFWRTTLHFGLVAESAFPPVSVTLQDGWQSALAGADGFTGAAAGASDLEIVFDVDPTIYDGRYANNGWLQELPNPVTKLTWDNAAIMSPATAAELGLKYESFAHGGEHGGYHVPMLELQLGERRVKAPAWVMPGHADGAVTVYLGHGRTAAARVAGQWQHTLGFDAYSLRTTERLWFGSGLELVELGTTYPLACTQAHHYIGERDVIRSTTLSEYQKHPHHAVEQKEEHLEKILERTHPPASLYEPFDYSPPQQKWGMSIDLTTCTGCSACVVACQAENNIPVVGKDQVLFGREMHWLRVDRYIHGKPREPDEFYFQPVPCMHCEQAPCEYVCPVAATVHSADGLNEMIYNRCVGTRFCSNNCPYKVRRFNFLEYADFETVPLRLQYNPDVTVRSRGVMEKCTYCVQRIRQAEINAASANRPIADGEILTACQAACPTKAIVFGDINDVSSTVRHWKDSPLDYALLAELNTHPRTTYVAALRNPNPEMDNA